jgi:hypothetical protein
VDEGVPAVALPRQGDAARSPTQSSRHRSCSSLCGPPTARQSSLTNSLRVLRGMSVVQCRRKDDNVYLQKDAKAPRPDASRSAGRRICQI